ncbi:unnamed protein product, partial [Rotaria sp. Silwood1]
DNNKNFIKFNVTNQYDQQYKHDLDTNNQDLQTNFIQGGDFRNQIKYAIESGEDKENLFSNDTEDILSIELDITYAFNKFNINISENYKQLFSLIDLSFKQTLSIPSNHIKQQLLSIIFTRFKNNYFKSVTFGSYAFDLLTS